MILLETARLRLRRFTVDDADVLVELDSDPEVMRYITGGRPTPREAYVNTFMPRWFEIGETEDGRRACKYEISRAEWLAGRA
jgi:RimJ/RimL family protein N-acetyltransferase